MWTATTYHDLISGRQRGWRPATLRAALRGLEVPYACAMWCRNRWYDRHPQAIQQVAVPVVSVGNLTLGGTGKTPLVVWLARWFRERDVRVSLVSRGYGATDQGRNDEARELEELLPDVPHLQNRDRVAASRIAVEELDTQLILLDDGFQHRRLHRDLDVVLLDATAHDGWGHIFPRGTLRESPRELARAQAIVLSRSDLCSSEKRQSIRRWAEALAPESSWTEFAHRPVALIGTETSPKPIAELAGRRIAAFCGIGNPINFRVTLERCGAHVLAWREFPDHHAYTRPDVESLASWASNTADVEAVLCTRKDLVKIGLAYLGRLPLMALEIAMQPSSDATRLETQLAEILQRTARESQERVTAHSAD